jgi:CheY-like chemotaxis protein
MGAREARMVYVVEDDPGVRALLETVLGTLYTLRTFESGQDALEALRSAPPDVLVTDLQVGDFAGEDLAWAAGNLENPPRVVVMSGDRRRLLRAAQWAQAAVPKPFTIPALIGAIEAETPAPS